jgi:thiol-disulfide isomerase/thioredoxin
MKRDCHNTAFADDFVHDELSQDERERFMLHLETCSECRIEVEHLRQLAEELNAAYSPHLDETFNYRILNNLRKEELAEERKEMRVAFEDIVISLATLLVIVILGFQVFDRPTVSPVEMVGSLTNIEKSSLEQGNFSNDQVLELVLRSK